MHGTVVLLQALDGYLFVVIYWCIPQLQTSTVPEDPCGRCSHRSSWRFNRAAKTSAAKGDRLRSLWRKKDCCVLPKPYKKSGSKKGRAKFTQKQKREAQHSLLAEIRSWCKPFGRIRKSSCDFCRPQCTDSGSCHAQESHPLLRRRFLPHVFGNMLAKLWPILISKAGDDVVLPIISASY